MSQLIDDIDECRIVVEQLICRTALTELVGPLVPDRRSLTELMSVSEGEETEIDLVDEDGQIVAALFVDILSDPVDGWRLGLRGWRLADDVASL